MQQPDPAAVTLAGRPRLQRGAATWFGYGAQTLYAAVLYGSGPVTALVRREHGLGFLAVSLLPAMLALGAAAGGALAGRLLASGVRDPAALTRLSLIVVAIGTAGLALPLPAAVAAAFLVSGAAGGMILASVTVQLRRLHGDGIAMAVLEVNVIAAGGGVAQTALLAVAAATGQWRLGLLPVVVLCPVLAAVSLRLPRTTAAEAVAAPLTAAVRARLNAAARWYVVGTMAGGAVEFAVVLWGADLVVTQTGATPAAAAGMLTAFTGGLVGGRAIGSRLAATLEHSRRLLITSLLLTAAGATALLLAPNVPGAIVALALTGLGVASLFPVGTALAVAAAGNLTARASAAVITGVSLSVLVAPVALAALADAIGLQRAFITVPLLALLALIAAVRASARPAP